MLSASEIADLVNCVDKRYEYHHVNALGSNIVSTDDNQNVLARYEYDVFGAIRSETGMSDNTRKFTGKEFDADSNLYYYGARYYDPYIGRFTQRDPIGDGVNWYAYTRNNPLKFVDPTGMRSLYASERGLARVIFGRTINLASVTVRGGLIGRIMSLGYDARASGNTIFISKATKAALMMHELTHVWQWQNDIFGGKLRMAWHGLYEGIAALFDHDEVYKAWDDSKPPGEESKYRGVEAMAVRVQDIVKEYLGRSMRKLDASQIVTFVNDEMPFLIWLQTTGSGGSALLDTLNQVDVPDIMYGLVSQIGTDRDLWEAFENVVTPGATKLLPNHPNPTR